MKLGNIIATFLITTSFHMCRADAYKVGVLDQSEEQASLWLEGLSSDQDGIAVSAVPYAEVLSKPDVLGRFDCLVLADSPRLPEALNEPLKKFAKEGGDLIFAGGRAFSEATGTPFTDLVFVDYPRYRYDGEYAIQLLEGLQPGLLPKQLPGRGPVSGWSALGVAFPRQSEFIPLLEVLDARGRRQAWAASLLRHFGNEYRGGRWLVVGVENAGFYRSPEMRRWMIETVRAFEPPVEETPEITNAAAAPRERIRISEDHHLVLPDGSRFFMTGANYCGIFGAKLEVLFEEDAFSAERLDTDFAKTKEIGINSLRSFAFGRMGTLEAGGRVEAIRASAQRHGIYLMPEIGLKALNHGPVDLKDNVAHAAAVARAYRGEPMLLAYDLSNEPYLTEVGAMPFYGEPCPLVKLRPYETMTELMDTKLNKQWVDRQMENTDGWLNLPKWAPEETKRQLLASVSIWVAYMKEHGALDSTFHGLQHQIDIANSGKWAPFLTALNETFTTWIDAMTEAIRREDPGALVTVGYNTALVALPGNEQLDFISNHIYQKPYAYQDTLISLTTYDRLHKMFPDKPISLGEFGLSNGLVLRDKPAGYQAQALWEFLHYLYAHAHGYEGCMKWMLNDWTTPYIHRYAKWWTDPKTLVYEEQFGLFSFDGTETGTTKPIAWCVDFLTDYLKDRPAPGELRVFESDNQVFAGFEYKSADAWFFGGEACANDAIRWTNNETKVLMALWDVASITLLSTVDLEIEFHPAALTGSSKAKAGDAWQTLKLYKGEPITWPRK